MQRRALKTPPTGYRHLCTAPTLPLSLSLPLCLSASLPQHSRGWYSQSPLRSLCPLTVWTVSPTHPPCTQQSNSSEAVSG